MAATLRHEIGPAVDEPFAKTQAFMASVVLTKLAGQLAAADADARAAAAERGALVAELDASLAEGPVGVRDALDRLRGADDDAVWNGLVIALYAARDELGGPRFDAALGKVRAALRARLDRALVYAA